ncbi:MAG: metallophosphoesterase family protein [Ignavibacteriales bacterium]|nr:metallophosphoesterase family protein [Ignavibacteriales bacterium]
MKIGIVSDIHEDAVRLTEAIRHLEKNNCDELVCLGDITGFDVIHYRYLSTRSASRAIAIIRENCRYVVTGNHDLYAIRKLPNCNGAFTFPADWYTLDYEERERLSNKKVWLFEQQELPSLLNAKEREYLHSLPDHLILEVDDKRILFSHSLHPDFSGSLVWRPHDVWDFRKHFHFMKEKKCSLGFSGHLHPSGIAKATHEHYTLNSFGVFKIKNDFVQYICPCIANSSNKNGFLIVDTDESTLIAVQLKSKKYRINFFS